MRMIVGLAVILATGLPLVAEDATVAVSSQPTSAKIYVDGYFKGRTPATVRVSSATEEAKPYRFTLHLPGFKSFDTHIQLAAGQNKSLYAAMERLPAAVAGHVVCIDPGHPSETSAGTSGPRGSRREHNQWGIATEHKDNLETAGTTVVMTKESENQKVTNRRRAEIANAAKADIMIRLHCDAAPSRGFSLYYPDRQGTKYGVTGPSQSVIDASQAAAGPFYEGMKSVLSMTLQERGIHGDSVTYVGSRQGALTGSIFSQVPVLTIEMCVLTNAQDEAFITSASGQSTMVKALRAGLEYYFRAP